MLRSRSVEHQMVLPLQLLVKSQRNVPQVSGEHVPVISFIAERGNTFVSVVVIRSASTTESILLLKEPWSTQIYFGLV